MVLPARAVGREDRHLHQRRPHRAPLRAGRRSARRGPQRPRHLGGLRAADGVHRPQRPADPALGEPEEAFDAWRECSRGRPCDYSGLSYDMLRERGGIQWPCTDEAPDGTERLYTDSEFSTDDD